MSRHHHHSFAAPVFSAFLALAAALPGAQRAADYPQALDRAKATGADIAVFLHGSDWSRASAGIMKNIWGTEAFARETGDGMILLGIDHKEGVEQKNRDLRMAGMFAPGHAARILAAKSRGGATLAPQADKSILATGKNPSTDIYTLDLRCPAKPVDVVTLEMMLDPSLKGGGPGRAKNGNFVVNEIELFLVEGNQTRRVPAAAAWADRIYNPREAENFLIDGNADPAHFWNAGAHKRHQNMHIALVPETPLPAESSLRVVIHSVAKNSQHTPGRLKVGLVSSPEQAADVRATYAERSLQRRNAGLPCSSLNYPALFLLDSEGRMVARREGLSLADTREDLVKWLREKQELRRKRDELWKAARAAEGPKRAALLSEGLRLTGMGLGPKKIYQPILDEILKADPDDSTHAARPFTLDTRALEKKILALAKEQGPGKAAARLDTELNHPGNQFLAPGKMQSLYWVQYRLYQSEESLKGRALEPLRKIAALDPDSPLGYGCAGKVLMASGPPSVRYGWAERHCSAFPATWTTDPELESLAVHFPHPGEYKVTLTLGKKGELGVASVSLLDGDRVMASAKSPARLDAKHKTADFRLAVPALSGNESLRLRIDCTSGKPGNGSIAIAPVVPPEPESEPSGFDPKKLAEMADTLARDLKLSLAKQPGGTAEALETLAADADYALKLTRWETLRVADPAKLADLVSTKRGLRFFQSFLDDREWMTMWLCCGPHSKEPAKELEHLAALHAHDPATIDNDPVFRRLATALAVAGNGAIATYDYFKESHELGRLHRMFYHHAAWTMRFTIGISPGNGRFLRDRYSKPIHTYGNIHYQARYRLHSIFGDSIHGRNFYRPWQGLPRMQQIKYAGGVCGSLTTLGDNIYKSLGVPAQGMGEPGHRSYVVRFDPGHWSPRYSMKNPKRTRSFYGGLYEDLDIMEKVWADLDAVHRASLHLWQAHLHASGGPETTPAQRDAYVLALRMHPLFLDAWHESIDAMKRDPATTPEAWLRVTRSMVPRLAPLGPKAAYDLWHRYAKKSTAGLSPKQTEDMHMAVLEIIHKQHPAGFRFLKNILEEQSAALPSEPQAAASFFARVLGTYATTPGDVGVLAEWGANLAARHPADMSRYAKLLVDKLALRNPKTDPKLKSSVLDRFLKLARDKKAFETYRALGIACDQILPFDDPKQRHLNAKQLADYPKIDPLPGTLLSSEGILTCQRPSKYDRIVLHPRVLDTRGGFVQVNPHTDPWVVVELPRPARLSGVIAVNRWENKESVNQLPLKIAVSMDGKKWTEIYQSTENQPVWRVDLRKDVVEARFVKVFTHHEKPALFNLRNLLIYGVWKKP
jgi:hypothetical protein